MSSILQNWNFARILRAALAIWIITEAARTGEWMFLIPGGLFALQAILNVGCCGSAGCAATPNAFNHENGSVRETVIFEEVKKPGV
jgi:hypothetical protein